MALFPLQVVYKDSGTGIPAMCIVTDPHLRFL